MPDPLEKRAESFVQAWSELDSEGVGAFFTEESRALWLGHPILKGCDGIRKALSEAFSRPGLWTRIQLLEVNELVPGEAGYSIAEYTSGIGEPGEPPAHEGKFVALWKHDEELGWQVVVHSSSPDDVPVD